MEFAGKEGIELSIILPVRNEGRFIQRVLSQLDEQDYPKSCYEIILVDGDSRDNTLKEAGHFKSSFPNFRILENPGRLSSRARNIGVRSSRGTYIVFIDGHCNIPSQTLLSDIVNLFEKSGADALCRPQPLTLKPQTSFQRAVAYARASVLGHALDSTIYTNRERFTKAASSGAMYRRSVFDRVGYFDESFDACEDVELNTRIDKAGLRAYTSPRLTIEYAARQNIASLFKQLYRYGVGRWKLFRKHPATLGSGTLVTAAFTAGALIYPLLWFFAPALAATATAPALLYLATIISASVVIAGKSPQKLLLIYLPAIFFTIHFALGYGFLIGIIRHRT